MLIIIMLMLIVILDRHLGRYFNFVIVFIVNAIFKYLTCRLLVVILHVDVVMGCSYYSSGVCFLDQVTS